MGIKPLEEKCKDNLSVRLRKSNIPAYKRQNALYAQCNPLCLNLVLIEITKSNKHFVYVFHSVWKTLQLHCQLCKVPAAGFMKEGPLCWIYWLQDMGKNAVMQYKFGTDALFGNCSTSIPADINYFQEAFNLTAEYAVVGVPYA